MTQEDRAIAGQKATVQATTHTVVNGQWLSGRIYSRLSSGWLGKMCGVPELFTLTDCNKCGVLQTGSCHQRSVCIMPPHTHTHTCIHTSRQTLTATMTYTHEVYIRDINHITLNRAWPMIGRYCSMYVSTSAILEMAESLSSIPVAVVVIVVVIVV